MKAIENLVAAEQAVTDTHESAAKERAALEAQISERIREVEVRRTAAFRAATKAGWTTKDLRGIGITAPAATRTSRSNSTRENES